MAEIESNLRCKRTNTFGDVIKFVLGWGMFVLFASFVRAQNILLFHTSIELFGIIAAFIISFIAYNTSSFSHNNFFKLIGFAYAFIGGFSVLHTLSYGNLGVFQGDTSNISIQYSTISKYIECLSLLAAYIISRKYKDSFAKLIYLFLPYVIISGVVLLSVIYFKILPVCVVNDSTPTLFKAGSEFFITGILIGVLVLLLHDHKKMHPDIYRLLVIALAFKVVSQLFIMIYSDIYDNLSMFGHIFRFISFYYVYKLIVEACLKTPYKLLFYELSRANEELKKENIERKKIEESLSESEEQYRTLVELLPDGIFVTDGNRFVYSNKVGARFLGFDRVEDVIGKKVFEFIHLDEKENVKERVNKVSAGENRLPIIERRCLNRNGGFIYTEAASTPCLYKGKDLILSVLRDITERKHSEELQRKMDENTKLLEVTLELDKLKTEFFTNISHELRTPVSVILCALQLFELNLNKASESKSMDAQKHIQTMRQNCLRLLKLINNLIDATKIDAGFYEIHLQNYDVVYLVEEITLSIAEFVKSKDLNLKFETGIEEKIIATDPDKIERIVLNLLSNAVKFTEPGGSIHVSVREKTDKVMIIVKDTGKGIPKDKLNTIFERFRQIDKSLTRNHEGSGIGLSLVKSLTEMLGGKISVDSELGIGSEFMVELPVKELPGEKNANISFGKERKYFDYIEKMNIEFSDIYV